MKRRFQLEEGGKEFEAAKNQKQEMEKMKKSSVKVCYSRKKALGIISPFYHSNIEINYRGKITKIGFYAKNNFYWFLSLIMPAPGEIRNESRNILRSEFVTGDERKIKKLLKLIKEPQYQWRVYLAIFRNCFHWRNAVLDNAGIEHPENDWF